jgi:branched-chain amino acid transport system substrate-binding protein
MKFTIVKLSLITFALVLALITESNAESPKLRIGISVPLSGPIAEYGTAVRNGITLAQELNKEKFQNVEVLFEDSKYESKAAVQIFQSFKDINKVDLVYVWGNPTSEAVAPLAERYSIPTIAMSSDPKITEGRKMVIRSINAAFELGQLLGESLKRRGYKNLAVVEADNTYLQGLRSGMEAALKGFATVETLGRFTPDDQNLNSAILRLNSKNFDAIGIFLFPGQLSTFSRAIAAQKISLPIFGSDMFDNSNEIKSAGPAAQRAIFPTFDVMDGFKEEYLKRFGNDIQIPFAANAHDVVMLIASTFGAAGSAITTPESRITKLLETRDFPGANGKFSVLNDERGGPSFRYPIIMKVVKGDSTEKLTPIGPG